MPDVMMDIERVSGTVVYCWHNRVEGGCARCNGFVRLVQFIAHGKVHSTCVSGISLCSTASIWVPSSTLWIVLLLIISMLSIIVVLDVFLEGNSSNLRVACGAFSLIDYRRAKVISAHCVLVEFLKLCAVSIIINCRAKVISAHCRRA